MALIQEGLGLNAGISSAASTAMMLQDEVLKAELCTDADTWVYCCWCLAPGVKSDTKAVKLLSRSQGSTGVQFNVVVGLGVQEDAAIDSIDVRCVKG